MARSRHFLNRRRSSHRAALGRRRFLPRFLINSAFLTASPAFFHTKDFQMSKNFHEANYNKPNVESVAGYAKDKAPAAATFNKGATDRGGIEQAAEARRQHGRDLVNCPTGPAWSSYWTRREMKFRIYRTWHAPLFGDGDANMAAQLTYYMNQHRATDPWSFREVKTAGSPGMDIATEVARDKAARFAQ